MKTIGELALAVPNAIDVFERWDIDYCCGATRPLDEACRAAGVTVAELMAEIGTPAVIDENRDWPVKKLASLQQYIIDTHHLFTRQMLDTVLQLSEKVAMRHSKNHPEVVTVYALVEDLYNDLVPHMMKEEQVLFPYISELESARTRGEPVRAGAVKDPIRMMMLEHDTVAIKLQELRSVTSDYELPDDACLSYRALYERLIDLEQDLHRHIHLENNLLFPRAAVMEEATLSFRAAETARTLGGSSMEARKDTEDLSDG